MAWRYQPAEGTLVIDLMQDSAEQAPHAALLYASTDEF